MTNIKLGAEMNFGLVTGDGVEWIADELCDRLDGLWNTAGRKGNADIIITVHMDVKNKD